MLGTETREQQYKKISLAHFHPSAGYDLFYSINLKSCWWTQSLEFDNDEISRIFRENQNSAVRYVLADAIAERARSISIGHLIETVKSTLLEEENIWVSERLVLALLRSSENPETRQKVFDSLAGGLWDRGDVLALPALIRMGLIGNYKCEVDGLLRNIIDRCESEPLQENLMENMLDETAKERAARATDQKELLEELLEETIQQHRRILTAIRGKVKRLQVVDEILSREQDNVEKTLEAVKEKYDGSIEQRVHIGGMEQQLRHISNLGELVHDRISKLRKCDDGLLLSGSVKSPRKIEVIGIVEGNSRTKLSR